MLKMFLKNLAKFILVLILMSSCILTVIGPFGFDNFYKTGWFIYIGSVFVTIFGIVIIKTKEEYEKIRKSRRESKTDS